jgi:hypothetical protein
MQFSTFRRSVGGRPVRLRGMSASMMGLMSRHSSSSTSQIVGILPLRFAILALLLQIQKKEYRLQKAF